MQDLHSRLGAMRRPRLLVRAARIGASEYRRRPHLARLLGGPCPPQHGAALLQLMELEEMLDDGRQRRAADYSAAQHVELLAAIIGEARALQSGLGASVQISAGASA
ncbi:DUF6477 family protein [Salipiger sp. PrR002]|uniref:DUF6477 family protein n=1 Tax=Salipiger sp. PrR002 TaxID=2706489 RepID=UPI0013BE30A4|nr:DUF6477 family protein [Salipiger sp. PrR002]NDV97958.1 hypothetical protein [Salipiger sp. PrR002]NDW55449.1 hypothetical protein [Salipiger sp. PrR004]